MIVLKSFFFWLLLLWVILGHRFAPGTGGSQPIPVPVVMLLIMGSGETENDCLFFAMTTILDIL